MGRRTAAHGSQLPPVAMGAPSDRCGPKVSRGERDGAVDRPRRPRGSALLCACLRATREANQAEPDVRASRCATPPFDGGTRNLAGFDRSAVEPGAIGCILHDETSCLHAQCARHHSDGRHRPNPGASRETKACRMRDAATSPTPAVPGGGRHGSQPEAGGQETGSSVRVCLVVGVGLGQEPLLHAGLGDE